MDFSAHYRFEGSVFFVYDHKVLQKEEDLLEDAIIYFYPHSMPIDNQCLLCGQLMGLVQFCDTMFGSSPILYRFKKEKIAVKHVGQYTFALAGNNTEPDSVLIEQVDRLYSLFAFYHGSVDQVRLDCDNDKEMFLSEMYSLWEQYLAFIRYYGDHLPSVFNPMPYLPAREVPSSCFLKASHILQACQRRPQVIAGCILYKRFILCTQLMDSISRCLLLLKPNQNQHPAIPIETDFQLPFGVRVFNVYLCRNDLDQLLEGNENSPYNSSQDRSASLKCCCRAKRKVTRRPRVPHKDPFVTNVHDNGQHSLEASERDPLTSSSGHKMDDSTTLCKAKFGDIILKGLKCCKCIEDEEGEVDEEVDEGSVCQDSVKDVAHNIQQQNGDMRSGVADSPGRFNENLIDQNRMDLERAVQADRRRTPDLYERASQSRQSTGTTEGESGIEVTGSDWHSSTTTPLDQRSDSAREDHLSRQIVSRDFEIQTRKGRLRPRAVNDDGGPCEISRDAKGLHGMQEDLDELGSLGRSSKAPDTHSECDGLDDSSDHIQGLQEMPYGDQMGPAGTFDGNRGSQVAVNDRESQGAPSDDIWSSNFCDNDDESVRRTRGGSLGSNGKAGDGIGSREVTVSSRRSHLESQQPFDYGEESPRTTKDNRKRGGICGSQTICDGVGMDDTSGASTSKKVFSNQIVQNSGITRDNSMDGSKLGDGFAELEEGEGEKEEYERHKRNRDERDSSSKCCTGKEIMTKVCLRCFLKVDDLVHANLFVQAHSEIVLILLTDCDLHRNEDAVKSLWNTSLSELGGLDILLRHSSKVSNKNHHVPYNYLVYDNFEKAMSGNLKEPVYAADHVFCDTAKTLHAQFENAPHLVDVTLGNLHTSIYGRRTLTKEVYYQESVTNPSSSQRHQPHDAPGHLEKTVRERLLKDQGLHFI